MSPTATTERPALESPPSPAGIAPPPTHDYLAAVIGCSAITLGFLTFVPAVCHWFVFPVWASGVLAAVDIVQWWRTRDRLARARYFASLLGTFMLFVAPLLHVALNNWMQYVVPPPDWRPWIGGMAVLNTLGLVGYRLAIQRSLARRRRPSRVQWRLRRELLVPGICIGLVISAVAQAYLYLRFGGVIAFASTVPGSYGTEIAVSAAQFAVAESFPYLLLLWIGVRYERTTRHRNWKRLWLLLVAYAVIALLFGGLRGSRANIVWPTVAVLAMVDLLVRRVPRLMVPLLVSTLVVFTLVYGYFKSEGLSGLLGATNSDRRVALESRYNRALDDIVLGDLGRADVQAFLLYRLYRADATYSFALGETYAGALALPVPPSVWPDRPETKLVSGTEAQYGEGQLGPGHSPSSRVYGLQGEALLNFGALAVPVSLWLFGFLVCWVDKVVEGWRLTQDARLLLAPLLLVGTLQLFIQDSDILMFFVVKTVSIPFLLLLVTCARSRTDAPAQQGVG